MNVLTLKVKDIYSNDLVVSAVVTMCRKVLKPPVSFLYLYVNPLMLKKTCAPFKKTCVPLIQYLKTLSSASF